MKFNWRKFGHDVRSYRVSQGLGLRECARLIGAVDKSVLCRAEAAKPVTAPHFLFLCEWMERNPLLYRVQAPRPD